jgi:hypothetical protein
VGAPLFGVVARVKRAAEVANGDELVSMAIVEGAVPASVGKNEKEIGPSIGGGGVRHGACSIVVEVRPLAARLQRRRVARAEDTRVCREGGGAPVREEVSWAGCYGPGPMNNMVFHLIQIFKQIQICNGSKHIFPCSKNSK